MTWAIMLLLLLLLLLLSDAFILVMSLSSSPLEKRKLSYGKTPTLDFTSKFLCLLVRGFGFFILTLSLTFSSLLYMVSAHGLDGEYLIYKPMRFYQKERAKTPIVHDVFMKCFFFCLKYIKIIFFQNFLF
jgi:hypothetical protein